MKRKIVYAASAWAAGLVYAAFVPIECKFIIIPTVLILFLLMKFLFKFKIREIFTVLIVFAMAVGLYRAYDVFIYRKIIFHNENEISFDGKITDISEYNGDKCSYTVKGKINGKDSAEIKVYADLYDCTVNDRMKFKGVAEIYENDYLFSSLDYNKSKGIFLTCYEVSSLEIIPDNSFSATELLYNYRQKITKFVKRNLSQTQSAMLCGMLFGDKSEMDEDDKTLFYRTGIGHVMAVSGLHLVLFCTLFNFVFDKIRLGRVKRFIILQLVMTAFAITGGLSESIMRASLMMTLVNLAPLFFRKADTLNSIGIAFILLTAVNPFAITNPSLVLSVAGTFGAGVLAPYLTKNFKTDTLIKRQCKNAVYMFWVSFSVMPFSIIFFGESSLLSPLANIFITPLCMAALMLALISSLTVFLNPVFLIKLSGALCEFVMFVVRYTGKFKFSGINFSEEIKYVSAVFTVVCVIVFLIFKSRKSLIISMCTTFAIFVVSAFSSEILMSDKLRVAILGDKGNDVIVLLCDDRAQIIDISGRKKNVKYALRFLQQNNIHKVEGIILKSNAYQAMSAYNNGLELIKTERVIMPSDIFVRDDMTVCGITPEFTDFSDISFDMDNLKIRINDTRIAVEYGEFDFICDSSCNDTEAKVYVEYENVFNPPKANAVIVAEYENINGYENLITRRNVQIIAESDGSFLIGGL